PLAKVPLPEGEAALELPEPVLSADNLSPAAAVYWREAEAGTELGLETRILVPLQLLVEQYPEFIPGHIRYAQALIEYDRSEEAIAVMLAAATRYPAQPDLLMAQVEVLMHAEQWIEASIAARQFAVLNPRHPEHDAMLELANTNLDRFRRELRQDLQGNVIGNIVTGALGYALTGGLFGPFSALDSTLLLLRGESGMGDRIAEQAREQLPVVTDPEVTAYINGLGQRLARVAGRDEFDYEFYVVLDERLNAFALPGGKIFINAGAILKTESAAELAGLLAHEISHAVLSHGFQLATEGNLAASLAQYIPVPAAANIATGLVVTGYSRQMERQADVMGTQILAASGYAADGLYRLMMTLDQEAEERAGLSWFATHPRTDDRVLYLAELVETGGYKRFAYEGVEPHLEIQQRVTTLLKEYELQERLEEAQ
ncbi:MAG: M48 family metalloprotease, partial [Leptolyngbya sp. SIO4C5]|nr:M48 family metalloprotease [Leptolyngbya sp. SIO4C5]